jgi:hypothetical protein
MHIELSLHRLQRRLLLATSGVALAGLAVEVCDHVLAPAWAPVLVPLLSLSYEHNLPTWYAVLLHASCALLLALHALSLRQRSAAPPAAVAAPGPSQEPAPLPARSPKQWSTRWILLSGLFAYISLDELIQLHEVASGWFDTTGVLYFGWVIPAAALVIALGLWYLPLVRALPARTRRRFILAGVVFVSGALLMELPLGWWTERAGADNLTYGIIDWVEETLELSGVSMFLLALLDIPGRAPEALRISITPTG